MMILGITHAGCVVTKDPSAPPADIHPVDSEVNPVGDSDTTTGGDSSITESAPGDSGAGDSGTGDSGTGDSGTGDSGSGDSGASDSGADDTGDTPVEPVLMADFQLADLNPSSVRYGETVSPRDYLERASGWYFIHST